MVGKHSTLQHFELKRLEIAYVPSRSLKVVDDHIVRYATYYLVLVFHIKFALWYAKLVDCKVALLGFK